MEGAVLLQAFANQDMSIDDMSDSSEDSYEDDDYDSAAADPNVYDSEDESMVAGMEAADEDTEWDPDEEGDDSDEDDESHDSDEDDVDDLFDLDYKPGTELITILDDDSPPIITILV